MEALNGMVTERLDSLLKVVGAHEQVLILPHNDPDPDAIATCSHRG